MNDELQLAKQQMKETIEHFTQELGKIRTGRANPQMLAGITVEVYGQQTPLEHAATINAVDAQLLQITPYDPSNLEAVSAAIRDDQSLGLNPADDGKVVRVPIPSLTTERREQIVKQVGEKSEQAKVSLRNARHDALDAAKSAKKDSDISEDDYHRFEKQVGEALSDQQDQLETLAEAKEKEIMTV